MGQYLETVLFAPLVGSEAGMLVSILQASPTVENYPVVNISPG